MTIKRDKKNAFQSMYYAECKEYADGCVIIDCPFDCPCEIEEALFDRLGQIEDILGDDYDLDRLRELMNQRMTMREDVAERMKLVGGIPMDRLRELVEADRDGRCVVLPCKVGSPVWRVYDDCEFPGDCGTKQKCNGCEYRNIFAEEQAFCLSMLSQNGKLGHPYYTSIEAAEAALKGDRHG